MEKSDKETIEDLRKKIEFAERSWKDASQANFLMEKKISEYEAKINELNEYKKAYIGIVNSRTWRLARKIKRLFGVK